MNWNTWNICVTNMWKLTNLKGDKYWLYWLYLFLRKKNKETKNMQHFFSFWYTETEN